MTTKQHHVVESVWMYKGSDGEWKPFMNEEHRLNTIADGGWDVREFFATPFMQGDIAFVLGDAARRAWLEHGNDSWVTIGRDIAAELQGRLPQPAPEVLAKGYFHPLPDENDYEFHDAENFPDGSDCPACVPAVIVRKSAVANQLAPDVAALVEALEQIERWDGFPSTDKTWEGSGEPVSYGAAFGSNGERDFMREVARKALAAYSKQQEGGQ